MLTWELPKVICEHASMPAHALGLHGEDFHYMVAGYLGEKTHTSVRVNMGSSCADAKAVYIVEDLQVLYTFVAGGATSLDGVAGLLHAVHT